MASGGRYTSSSTESDGYYPPARGRHYSGEDDRVYHLTSNLRASIFILTSDEVMGKSVLCTVSVGCSATEVYRAFNFYSGIFSDSCTSFHGNFP